MANAIRKGYSDLFEMYSDAHRKDDEALRNFFSPRTGLGRAAIEVMVRTFKIMCGLAEFEAESGAKPGYEEGLKSDVERHVALDILRTGPGMAVNINIQLQLPATDDASVYENLFAALKKYFPS